MRKFTIKYSKDTSLPNIYATNKISDIISQSKIKEPKIEKLKTIQNLIDLFKGAKNDFCVEGMKIIELDKSIFGLSKTSDIDYTQIVSHPSYDFHYIFNNKDLYVYYWIPLKKSKNSND